MPTLWCNKYLLHTRQKVDTTQHNCPPEEHIRGNKMSTHTTKGGHTDT